MAAFAAVAAVARAVNVLMKKRELRAAPVPRSEFDELRGKVDGMSDQLGQVQERLDAGDRAQSLALADHREKMAAQIAELKFGLERKIEEGNREVIEAVRGLVSGDKAAG